MLAPLLTGGLKGAWKTPQFGAGAKPTFSHAKKIITCAKQNPEMARKCGFSRLLTADLTTSSFTISLKCSNNAQHEANEFDKADGKVARDMRQALFCHNVRLQTPTKNVAQNRRIPHLCPHTPENAVESWA